MITSLALTSMFVIVKWKILLICPGMTFNYNGMKKDHTQWKGIGLLTIRNRIVIEHFLVNTTEIEWCRMGFLYLVSCHV